jgi:hypothetical protein
MQMGAMVGRRSSRMPVAQRAADLIARARAAPLVEVT